MTTAEMIAPPPCPQCGGPMQDNRNDPGRPAKAPEFRCYDKNCKDEKGYVTGVYIKDLPKKNGAAAPRPAARTAQPTTLGAQLPYERETAPLSVMGGVMTASDTIDAQFAVYSRCMDKARTEIIRAGIDKLGGDVAGAVVAAAATLFIQASKR